MVFRPPADFNMATYFLDARLEEERGDRTAILYGERSLSYAEVHALANRFGNVLAARGVQPEQRVVIALRDNPEFVGAFFGVLKIGAVVVMVNPDLKPEAIRYFLRYTRASAAVVDREVAKTFEAAGEDLPSLKGVLPVGESAIDDEITGASDRLESFGTHRDDGAVWLFSGGTTGEPKAVQQTHASFVNTTERYALETLGYGPDDVTLSVPKLYFGYATGSNLLFPFAAGATTVLFPDRSTPEAIFEQIHAHRPTILVNVPTMVDKMVSHPDAASHDLSCLRFATSAGEALPVPLHERWNERFGVDLLDGLGTAEMWHIFITNRPGEVRPGTLGTAVPGFDVRVRDDDGRDLPPGEVGWLWVRGGSRAIGYWQAMEKTQRAFRGEWYVSGDMITRDDAGVFRYCGRGDDMLKVSGKWLSPQEVEACLLRHPAVEDVAVIGVEIETGLVKPCAFVVSGDANGDLAEALQAHVREHLEPYKYPRDVVFVDALPRTHLGKVDRGRLRREYVRA